VRELVEAGVLPVAVLAVGASALSGQRSSEAD